MLASKDIPKIFTAWNKKYKAPFGSKWWLLLKEKYPWIRRLFWNVSRYPCWLIRAMGCFAFQRNSKTRIYEYPWCYYATPLQPGMKIIELGAGASGFQFVLAKCGLDVTSVDPLINPSKEIGWTFNIDFFRKLNRAFGNKVKFIKDFLQNAQLPSNYYDRVFSISVIEHIPQNDIPALMREIYRLLKPGGYFIATIDLFLDCSPFSEKVSNKYGSNISVRRLVEDSGLSLEIGNSSELFGYLNFKPDTILKSMSMFLNVNDTLTQCLVLKKIFKPTELFI